MTRRKKTDIVQFKLRIREALRRRLEANARVQERSLNSEIANRLENSFEQEKNVLILEALLAPGAGLDLVRAVATILRYAGRDWNTPPKSRAVAEAIRKIVAVLSHELPPDESSFPNRNEKGSVDQLAWAAVLVGQMLHETWPGIGKPIRRHEVIPLKNEPVPTPAESVKPPVVEPVPRPPTPASVSIERQHRLEEVDEETDDSRTDR
jgi:hypothetical protein